MPSADISIFTSPASPFWTLKILEHGRNITNHHIEIPKDDNNDEDLSCVVIVGVGIAVMIVMFISTGI